jgi:hypothetical protein
MIKIKIASEPGLISNGFDSGASHETLVAAKVRPRLPHASVNQPNGLINNKLFNRFKNELSVDFTNIRGLSCNLNSVNHHLEKFKPDVLVVTETQIRELGEELVLDGYQIEDSFKLHRGVGVFIKNCIAYSRLKSFEITSEYWQSITLKISLIHKVIFLISVYRSPSDSTSNCPSSFFNNLSDVCDDIRSHYPNAELMIVGDFNVHHSEWLGHSETNEAGIYAKFFSDSQDLTQLVNESTFIHPKLRSKCILDLCLTSLQRFTSVTVHDCIGSSDHALISTSISMETPLSEKPISRKIWQYAKADYSGLRKFFTGFPWEFHCLQGNDADVAAVRFTETVLHGMEKFIPTKFSNNLKRDNRFSQKSASAVKEKRSAYRKFIEGTIDYSNYRDIRNAAKKICDKEADAYNSNIASSISGLSVSDRQFYQAVNRLTTGKNKSSLPPLVLSDGSIVTSPFDKAEILADQFSFNSTLENSDNLEPPSVSPTEFNAPPLYFRKRIVSRYLKELDINKANGPDGIPARILKMFHKELAPILTKIFALSYKSGKYPSIWKCTNIQPIPKKGDKSDPANYRPIALVCVAAKIFEKYVNIHIVDFLEKHNLISDKQYGFRHQRSTGDLLTYVTHLWQSSLENFGESFVIALDISKAFDKVWHANLIEKVKCFGFDTQMTSWLLSFLESREISVVVDGFSSQPRMITAGVPQGSVLSPTLFLLYINDLLAITRNSIQSFADDTTLHSSIQYKKRRTCSELNSDRQKVISSINDDLEKIYQWGNINLVNFNCTKTQLCTISRTKKPNPYDIIFNGQILQNSNNLQILGLNISHKLKWNEHISGIAKNASKKLGCLNRCRKFFKSHQILQIYKAYIRPCIEYCSHIWGAASKSYLHLLDSIQRRAVRIIRNPSITDNLDSLQHRRDVADLSIFYKLYNGRCSSELRSLIPNCLVAQRSTREAVSSHSYRVVLKTSRTSTFTTDFIQRTASKWNALPPSVFSTDNSYNLQHFKTEVHKITINSKT